MVERALDIKSKDNCASLALRLLEAGGMFANITSSLSIETTSVVKPDVLLKQVVAAKEKELLNAEAKETEVFDQQLGTSSLRDIKERYRLVGQEANAELALRFGSFAKIDRMPQPDAKNEGAAASHAQRRPGQCTIL